MERTALILSPRAAQYAGWIAVPDGVRLLHAERVEDALPHLPEVSGIITFPPVLNAELLAAMPQLDWIQVLTSGTDTLQALDLPDRIALTSGRGAQADQLSELVFLQMLWFLRDVPAMLERQKRREWAPAPQRLLARKRVLIVGVGAISEELAKRCAAFGMVVTGCSGSRATAPHFQRIVPLEQLASQAAETDFLVVLTPYRPSTHNLVNRSVIDALPGDAVIINVARGAVVDEDALLAALEAGAIGGAALDVFRQEPLPMENPLWDCEKVLITPHIGGFSETHAEQIAPIVSENLRRWAEGSFPLINEVQLAGWSDQGNTYGQ